MKNKFLIENGVCIIYLQNGLRSVIDQEDFKIADGVNGTWLGMYNPHTKSYYCVCNIPSNGKTTSVRLHRLIMGATKKEQIVDHINHDTLNNTRRNICIATNRENIQNQNKAHTNNRCGFLGVDRIEKSGRYRAKININGKLTHLGMFNSPEDAHAEYLKVKSKYHHFALCADG